MKTFTVYESAAEYGRELATKCQMDVGLSKAREFGATVFQVVLLPRPENRTGSELFCEVIHPYEPATVVRFNI